MVALWTECGLTRPWNDPHRDIARKLGEQPELFFVAASEGTVVGSCMAGFDGHRGWISLPRGLAGRIGEGCWSCACGSCRARTGEPRLPESATHDSAGQRGSRELL